LLFHSGDEPAAREIDNTVLAARDEEQPADAHTPAGRLQAMRCVRRSLVAPAVAGAVGTIFAAVVAAAAAPSARHHRTPALLTNWPEFGLNAQRSSSTRKTTGITAANVNKLRLRTVALPGTADNAAIYLHDARVDGGRHDVAIVTTTGGITLAVDAPSGRTLWRFNPPGVAAGLAAGQITEASPIARGAFVYAASPDGVVHKLALANGREARGWPVRITPTPGREKLTSALAIADGDLLASTGGFYGDPPPYVGHLVAISLASGAIAHVFNTLCANRATIIVPASCDGSDSAIWSRGGPVVEPGAKRVLIATGNGPYNGTTDFGDSVIELTLPGLRLRQVYTPTDQAMLNSGDLDLGSGSPALLPGHLVLDAGKDGLLRLLNLRALDGRPPGSPARTGGEVQTLPTPGSTQVFTTPAVSGDLVFVADASGTSAYRVAGGRVQPVWQNGDPGTSPVVAGGLLYVYDFSGGGIHVYKPASGREVARLATAPGHWNSPIVVDRRVIETTGSQQLDVFSSSR
jgi:outer membrane protein assembly factor BamB